MFIALTIKAVSGGLRSMSSNLKQEMSQTSAADELIGRDIVLFIKLEHVNYSLPCSHKKYANMRFLLYFVPPLPPKRKLYRNLIFVIYVDLYF